MSTDTQEELAERAQPVMDALVPKLKAILEADGLGILLLEDLLGGINQDEQNVQVSVSQMDGEEDSLTLKLAVVVGDLEKPQLVELSLALTNKLFSTTLSLAESVLMLRSFGTLNSTLMDESLARKSNDS